MRKFTSGKVVEALRLPFEIENVRRAFNAITEAKRGLMVTGLRLLHPAEVLLRVGVPARAVGGLETVCVRVDYHAMRVL